MPFQQQATFLQESTPVKVQGSYQVSAVKMGYPVTFSSRHHDDPSQTWDVYFAGNTISVWEPSQKDKTPWIQVCSGKQKLWTGVAIQGRNGSFKFSMKTFRVDYSRDGIKWGSVDNGTIFNYTSQANPDTQEIFNFKTPVYTRTLRIVPLTFDGYVAVRFDAFFNESS